jgi:hypothetical protein
MLEILLKLSVFAFAAEEMNRGELAATHIAALGGSTGDGLEDAPDFAQIRHIARFGASCNFI